MLYLVRFNFFYTSIKILNSSENSIGNCFFIEFFYANIKYLNSFGKSIRYSIKSRCKNIKKY